MITPEGHRVKQDMDWSGVDILAGMIRRVRHLLVLLSLTICSVAQTTQQAADKASVQHALSAFIQAFDNLDWEKFRNSFADDATVFYPRKMPLRASGRNEFERGFKAVFEEIRAGRSQPPYMDIHPIDLQVQIAGDVAIATFHLDDRPGLLNRRTIVLRKFDLGWKIIHLHASEVAIATQTGR